MNLTEEIACVAELFRQWWSLQVSWEFDRTSPLPPLPGLDARRTSPSTIVGAPIVAPLQPVGGATSVRTMTSSSGTTG